MTVRTAVNASVESGLNVIRRCRPLYEALVLMALIQPPQPHTQATASIIAFQFVNVL